LITAQLAGNEVVDSVILTKAGNPLSREDVESHLEGELSRKE
jgi:hydroxymethylpyrimidine/phosphomethylpyrimidine kinase